MTKLEEPQAKRRKIEENIKKEKKTKDASEDDWDSLSTWSDGEASQSDKNADKPKITIIKSPKKEDKSEEIKKEMEKNKEIEKLVK